MSTKRTSGAGPVLDHEPSFDTEFAVSDEALNARPDGRARASRRPPKLASGPGRGPLLVGVAAAVIVAAAGAYLWLARPPASSPPAAAAPAPDPAPAPAPAATPTEEPAAARAPAPPPVTKVAPVEIPVEPPPPAPKLTAAPAPKPAAAPKPAPAAKPRRAAKAEEPDPSLDSALAKLSQLDAAPAAVAPAPAAADPGADCDAGQAEACVTFGKGLAAKDFNAALTAFERGCALGSNKGCLEGTRLAEKAGGGEKARELASIACGRGSATGCRLLASLFQRGVGGAPDAEKAKTFYTKACEAGDTAACGQ